MYQAHDAMSLPKTMYNIVQVSFASDKTQYILLVESVAKNAVFLSQGCYDKVVKTLYFHMLWALTCDWG